MDLEQQEQKPCIQLMLSTRKHNLVFLVHHETHVPPQKNVYQCSQEEKT